MDPDLFNLELRKFLKRFGITAQREIERAVDENSAFLYSIDVDPKMDVFRSDRRFTLIRDALTI